MPRPRLQAQKQRLTITVDRDTVKTIDRIKRTVPEIDGPSSAVRYLARWYTAINEPKPSGK